MLWGYVSYDKDVAGDIDMVMGGPPCQGVSGLNRHAATSNTLQDGRCGSWLYRCMHIMHGKVISPYAMSFSPRAAVLLQDSCMKQAQGKKYKMANTSCTFVYTYIHTYIQSTSLLAHVTIRMPCMCQPGTRACISQKVVHMTNKEPVMW